MPKLAVVVIAACDGDHRNRGSVMHDEGRCRREKKESRLRISQRWNQMKPGGTCQERRLRICCVDTYVSIAPKGRAKMRTCDGHDSSCSAVQRVTMIR